MAHGMRHGTLATPVPKMCGKAALKDGAACTAADARGRVDPPSHTHTAGCEHKQGVQGGGYGSRDGTEVCDVADRERRPRWRIPGFNSESSNERPQIKWEGGRSPWGTSYGNPKGVVAW